MKLSKNLFLYSPAVALIAFLLFISCSGKDNKTAATVIKDPVTGKETVVEPAEDAAQDYPPLDTALYNKKMKELANGDTTGKWPVKHTPYPLPGAILPFKRVVAYYGNLSAKKMGCLGEYPPKEMWRRLNLEVKHWEKADPSTPVQPAIHYIADVASGFAGKDGKYINRMPDKFIDSALAVAKMHNAIVFLDIQVALSTIRAELPRFEKYLKMPQVHLGIDPEFSMKTGALPGKKIGTYDADDVNYVTAFLAKIVRDNHLPPKIFTLHRFTKGMVTNYKNIKLHPEVQFVMHMDGWGPPDLKLGTYRDWIYGQPVQFTGFKLFYKNDILGAPKRMMTPEELVKLKPKPIYIQYQ